MSMTSEDRATFARMRDATTADYQIITSRQAALLEQHADRVLAALAALGHEDAGYAVSRLEHSLQSATRALRDGRTDDYVVMCLLHDIGDGLAPQNHGELAAAILRPFVSERLYWIAKHHPVFQLTYYGTHVGADPESRDRYAGHRWFDDTVEFCELYDENCFDPEYDSLALEAFEPLVRDVLTRQPFDADRWRGGSRREGR
jgi:predicted HD phosphohydrolase